MKYIRVCINGKDVVGTDSIYTSTNWTDTNRSNCSDSKFKLCPKCKKVIKKDDFKSTTTNPSSDLPINKDAGLLELIGYLKTLNSNTVEELDCRLQIWCCINSILIENEFDFDQYPGALHYENLTRLTVLFKSFPETSLIKQAEVNRELSNFQTAKELIWKFFENITETQRRAPGYWGEKDHAQFISHLCGLKDCLVREIYVFPDEELYKKEHKIYKETTEARRIARLKWEESRQRMLKEFHFFKSSWEKRRDEWESTNPEPQWVFQLEPLLDLVTPVTYSIFGETGPSDQTPPREPEPRQPSRIVAAPSPQNLEEESCHFIIWHKSGVSDSCFPLIFPKETTITERVEVKYTNEQKGIGILHEYWRPEDSLETTKKDLLAQYESLVKNVFEDTLENSVVALSNIAREEYGELCALKTLVSGKEIAPRYDAIKINYLINILSFLSKKIHPLYSVIGNLPFYDIEEELLQRICLDVIEIGDGFRFSSMNPSLHPTIASTFSILIRSSENQKAIKDFRNFQLAGLSLYEGEEERWREFLSIDT